MERKVSSQRLQPTGRRQLKSSEKRKRVLSAANKCFGRLGFSKTSVELIAREAGVSKALVFSFFGSKNALYDAVIEKTLAAWTGFAEHQAMRFQDQPENELVAMFRGSFEFAEHSPTLHVLMARRDREVQERLSSLPRIVRDWQNRFAEVVYRGIQQGAFRPDLDPHRIALIIHDIQHLYLDKMIADEQDYHADRMEGALELLLVGLRNPE